MMFIQNLVEYYDELFKISEAQKNLYMELCRNFSVPVRFLRVFCGSGLFESLMSKQGHDVTAIENSEELLHTANLRRRSQLMSIRFFQMEAEDMTKFLGKNFYNIVSVLDSRLLFLKGAEKIRQFFFDCKQLMSPDGFLVIQCINFENRKNEKFFQLKCRESMRARLFSEVMTAQDNSKLFSMNLETGSGRLLPIVKDIPIYPLLPSEIETFAADAGFKSAEFFAGFDKSDFTGNEEKYIVILK